MQIEMVRQCSENTVIEMCPHAEGVQRGQRFALIRSVRKDHFREEVTFDLGFKGCVGVHQAEKGKTRILDRKATQRHRDLRAHVGSEGGRGW